MMKLFEAKGHLTESNSTHFCDSVTVAVATNRDVMTKCYHKYATVEVDEKLTKGMVVINWNPQCNQESLQNKLANVIIVDEINTVPRVVFAIC